MRAKGFRDRRVAAARDRAELFPASGIGTLARMAGRTHLAGHQVTADIFLQLTTGNASGTGGAGSGE